MQRRQLSPAWIVCVILLVPLAVLVLFVLLGPSADRAGAQDLGPKQALLPAPKMSEEQTNLGSAARRTVNARSHAKNVATASPQRPSGKMEFVPDSPAPQAKRLAAAARSAANAVVRRQVPDQPAKVAIANPTPQVTPRLIGRSNRTRPAAASESVADRRPTQIARKELDSPEPKPAMAPEVLVSSQPELPAQIIERPEIAQPDFFEMPFEELIVRTPQRPMHSLDEDDAFQESPAGRGVVHLYFEEISSDEHTDEKMELVEREADEEMEFVEPDQSAEELPEAFAESTTASEIQEVAAQEQPDDAKAPKVTVAAGEEVQDPSDEVLAELKHPICSIEIRKAVEIPPLAAMEDPKLREPKDQALTMLRKRPPFKFWPVYCDPWVANRDSYAFHHNPLWFEDPNLERCGRGLGILSSGSSALQFCANIPILPYRMTAEPYGSCVRTLPDCTVCQKFGHNAYLPRWSWRAAAVQGAAVTGFIYLIP